MRHNTTIILTKQTSNEYGEPIDGNEIKLPVQIIEKKRSLVEEKDRKSNDYDLRLFITARRAAPYESLLTTDASVTEGGQAYRLTRIQPHFEFTGRMKFYELRLRAVK